MLAFLFFGAVFLLLCTALLSCFSLPLHVNEFFPGDGGTMLKVKQSDWHHLLLPKTNLFQQNKLQRKSTAGEFRSTFKSTAGEFGALLRVQQRDFGAFLRVQQGGFWSTFKSTAGEFWSTLSKQNPILFVLRVFHHTVSVVCAPNLCIVDEGLAFSPPRLLKAEKAWT